MKKNYLIYFVLLAFVTITFTNCKKDEATKPDNKVQLTGYDLQINQQMTGFKAKLASELKSGETMSVDSAIWYVSSLANYTYDNWAATDLTPGKVYYDSTSVSLPQNNGTLTMDEVSTFYDAVVDAMKELYGKVPETDKTFGALILEQQDGTIMLRVVMYSTWGLPGYLQFPESASYYFGGPMPNGTWCNIYPNAASKLQDYYGKYVWGDPTLIPYPTPHISWINCTSYPVEATHFTYETGSWNNYEHFDQFWNSTSTLYTGYHEYLCGDEMNFYLSRMINIANVKLPVELNIPVTSTYRCFQVYVNGWRNYPSYGFIIGHYNEYWYGTKVVTYDPPAPLGD